MNVTDKSIYLTMKATTEFPENSQAYYSCNTMRKQGTFCDAFIEIPGEEATIPVHRVIMADCSSYFRSLFTWGLDNATDNEAVVKICGISKQTMEKIVEYAYTKKVELNSSNVEDLFSAADRFHVFGLLKDCEDFLLDQLSAENCIGIAKFFTFHNCQHGTKKAWSYIKIYFKEIAEISPEFVQLEFEMLKEIISDDDIFVSNEKDVFLAVKRWIEYSPSVRLKHYHELFKQLRLVFIDEEFFCNAVLNDVILNQNEDTHALIARSQNMIDAVDESESVLIDLNESILRPRVPSEILFTVGGWSDKGVVDVVETYDKNVNCWLTETFPMPHPRAYHATLEVGGFLYIIGGFEKVRGDDRGSYLKTVKCFNPNNRRWEDRPSMNVDRCYVAGATLKGEIYACGGFDGRERHSSVEKYNPADRGWRFIQPMIFKRSDAGATECDGMLFVTGGFDGRVCLSSLEMYNPDTDQWVQLDHMTTRRSGVSMVSLNNSLYAIGGYDGSNRLTTVEQFSLRRNMWYNVSDMKLGRSNFSAVLFDNKIYAIGGYDGETTSADVECYDPSKKRWEKRCKLNIGRSAITACVMRNLPNGREFTFHGQVDSWTKESANMHHE